MKNFKLRFVLILKSLLVLFFYTSCNKFEDTEFQTDIKKIETVLEIENKKLEGLTILDGVMHFTDVKAFNSVALMINNIKASSYKEFCNQIGFMPLWLIHKNLLREIQHYVDNNDIENANRIIKENQEIFEKKGDQYELKLQAEVVAKFLSKDRIFYINQSLYYFDIYGQIVIENGAKDLLIKYLEGPKVPTEGVRFFKNKVVNHSKLRACGEAVDSGWILSPSNDKRRGIVYNSQTHIALFVGAGLYDYNFYSYFRGRAQKKTFGSWFDYSTDHNMDINSVARCYTTSAKTTIGNYSISESNLDVNNEQDIEFYAYIVTWPSVPPSTTVDYLGNFSNDVDYTNQGGVNISFECN